MSIVKDRNEIRRAALRVIRHILEWKPMNLRKMEARKDWLAPPHVSTFRRLEPLGFGIPDEDEWWCFNPEDCPPDLVWPMDVCIAKERNHEDVLSLEHVRTITPREGRGYVDRFSPFMVRADLAMEDRGTLLTAATVFSWLGGHWVNASKRTVWEGNIPTKDDVYEDGGINLATSIALRHRYEWAVALGLENSPSIRFATDPTGIKDLLRVRDLPEGRDRREALMTWVSDHWRQNRFDPDIEVYVRKHLRGALAFSWRGMEGEVIPAPFDIEQRDRLITERDAMRSTGADRRLRR